MPVRLRRLWELVNQGFWFLPAVLSAAAAGLAFLMLWIDRRYYDVPLPPDAAVWSGGAEGARELLATIAGSIITVAGVAFSVLIVALTLASSQFGPRLLRNFTRDRGHQVSLGVLLGTFLYCLLVLRTVRQADPTFVPHLSITAALLLAAGSVGVVIFFIHHVAASIQAENVVASIGRELLQRIPHYLPVGTHPRESAANPGDFDRDQARRVDARRSGYLQAIDLDQLIALARKCDLVLRLELRAGQFVTQGSAVAWVYPAVRCTSAVQERIGQSLLVGAQRTATQDIEYAVHQLVEVALRALSPSLNDPFTAIACLDWLGTALARIAQRSFPDGSRHDADRTLRVITPVSDFAGVVDAAFNQIRQAARHDVAVTIRLLEVLATVGDAACTPEQRHVLLKHARMVLTQSERVFPEEHDRMAVRNRYEAAVEASSSPRG